MLYTYVHLKRLLHVYLIYVSSLKNVGKISEIFFSNVKTEFDQQSVECVCKSMLERCPFYFLARFCFWSWQEIFLFFFYTEESKNLLISWYLLWIIHECWWEFISFIGSGYISPWTRILQIKVTSLHMISHLKCIVWTRFYHHRLIIWESRPFILSNVLDYL